MRDRVYLSCERPLKGENMFEKKHPSPTLSDLVRDSFWVLDVKDKAPDVKVDRDLMLTYEMAGTKKESISVKFRGENLILSYTRRDGVVRVVDLPVPDKYYLRENTHVTYQDGLLTIVVPFRQETHSPPVELNIEVK